MSEEKITATREEALGLSAKEAAEGLSLTALWNNSMDAVKTIPPTPDIVSRVNSNSETELWKRGMARWQRTKW